MEKSPILSYPNDNGVDSARFLSLKIAIFEVNKFIDLYFSLSFPE